MPCSHLPPDAPDPLRVEDRWLTETVNALARGVAADLAFDRLPVLADALEDAGCDSLPLLHHLRSDEPHRVECWALRRTLRTTLALPGGVPITFAYCPPGTFLMGSPETEAEREENELQHEVRLTRGFFVGAHPVTQAQWRAVMGTEPSYFKGEERPVESVSWDDAQRFCMNGREATGRPIRLPTEAEWEYACRGGTTTTFYFGSECNGSQANFYGDLYPYGTATPGPVTNETTPVGRYSADHPHPWGLGDVHGNVQEWCVDGYDPEFYHRSPTADPMCEKGRLNQRVLRGGSWGSRPALGRAAHRSGGDSDYDGYSYGFRVVFTA